MKSWFKHINPRLWFLANEIYEAVDWYCILLVYQRFSMALIQLAECDTFTYGQLRHVFVACEYSAFASLI